MAVRQYIGARYVPKFYENSVNTSEWTANTQYEPLTIVTRNGNSYTSKREVPANIGAPESAPEYWVSTGIYSQQIEQYRQEVVEVSNRIEDVEDDLAEETENREAADDEINATLTAVNEKVAKMKEGTTLGVISFGQIVYDDNNGMPDHPGSIAQYGNTQYILSSPINEGYTGIGTLKGHFRSISIEANGDYWQNKVENDYGHANSMCYSENINSLVYAPLWRIDASGRQTFCNYVETVSNQGVIGRRIGSNLNLTNMRINCVSYDAVKNVTYAFAETSATSDRYILAYNPETDLFEDTGIRISAAFPSVVLMQDVAVKDDTFYLCDTTGMMSIGDITTGEITSVKSIEQVPVSAAGEVYQEWDGLEFNANGDLLQLIHSEINTTEQQGSSPTYLVREAVCSIIQVLTDDSTPTYAKYADLRIATPNYSSYLNVNSQILQSRGSSSAPWKGFYQAQLSFNNPRRVFLIGNYTADCLFLFKNFNLSVPADGSIPLCEGILSD